MSTPIDDNLERHDDGSVRCRHCGAEVGDSGTVLSKARVRESAPSGAGPAVRAAAQNFTDRPVVLRQSFCPSCLVQLQVEIVPSDEPSSRTRTFA